MTKDDQIPAQKSIAGAWKWRQTLATQTGPGSLVSQHGSSQLEESHLQSYWVRAWALAILTSWAQPHVLNRSLKEMSISEE